MSNPTTNAQAREEILRSIRSHLASSVRHDEREEIPDEDLQGMSVIVPPENGESVSIGESFKEKLEAVNGHCIIARSELEIVRALTKIITDLQATNLRARRIALSNSPVLERLVNLIAVEVSEVCIAPTAADLFSFDVGITTAQGAIAETGTLVLDSSRERHRLTSLVPPVHIAIIDAAQIHQTLGEALSAVQSESEEISPIVTFVTGPSRTADIELTLAIGVHGPQELYVIVNEGPPIVMSETL
jgi:L-lactate dehydrogenase complex protein LldG